MSAAVDICNLALSFLGDSATIASIDPPEGSAQASHCARFYPIALGSILEMHDWSFIVSRVSLAALSGDYLPWQYAYACPADMLRPIAVLAQESDSPQEFMVEAGVDGNNILLTNQPLAMLRYAKNITDSTKLPQLFTLALARFLASLLAGSLLKGDQGRKESNANLQIANSILAQAKRLDANNGLHAVKHTPAWIAAR